MLKTIIFILCTAMAVLTLSGKEPDPVKNDLTKRIVRLSVVVVDPAQLGE